MILLKGRPIGKAAELMMQKYYHNLPSWCFEPSQQPQRILPGLKKQTSTYLMVIHATSHYTTS